MTDSLVDQRWRLLAAVLNGKVKKFRPSRQLQCFVDAVRFCLDKRPLYTSDTRATGYRHLDELDELPYENEPVRLRGETNYAVGTGNAAAPRVRR